MNLGIPLDTVSSLLHPKTKDILIQVQNLIPHELKDTPLAKILKKKTDEEDWKNEILKRLIRYKIIPLSRPKQKFNREAIIPMIKYSYDLIGNIVDDTKRCNNSINCIISLETQFKKSVMISGSDILTREINDLKSYLHTQTPKSFDDVINDLLKYNIHTVLSLMNPERKIGILSTKQFQDIKMIRVFFIAKVKIFSG